MWFCVRVALYLTVAVGVNSENLEHANFTKSIREKRYGYSYHSYTFSTPPPYTTPATPATSPSPIGLNPTPPYDDKKPPPFRYQYPPRYDKQNPPQCGDWSPPPFRHQDPPRYNKQNPPQYSDWGPPPFRHQDPPRYAKQNPLQYGDQKPPFRHQDPRRYGKQDPPQYGDRSPRPFRYQAPPRYGKQDPPQYGDQKPPSFRYQDPPRYGKQNPPQYSNWGPPPFRYQDPPQYGEQVPPPYGDQKPPPYGNQDPPQYGEQDPPQYSDWSPPSFRYQDPPQYSDQDPPQYSDQDPPQYGDQDPPQYGEQVPPPYGDQKPPPYGNQDPPQYGEQDPPQYSDWSPPSFRYQDPPQYSDQDPPQYSDQDPPQYGDQDPPQYGDQDPPQHGNQDPPKPQYPPPLGNQSRLPYGVLNLSTPKPVQSPLQYLQSSSDEDPCNPDFSDKPNFLVPGRRISEAKCMDYIWTLNRRQEMINKTVLCLAEEERKRSYYSRASPTAVGGRPAYSGEFPHMGAVGWLGVNGELLFRCGCSLISPNFVLTAAHCSKASSLNTVVADPVPKIVRFSYATNLAPRFDFDIKKIIVHPNYKPPKKYYDIALMELADEVGFSQFALPACLWTTPDTSQLGLEATLSGWGVLQEGSFDFSPILQAAVVDFIEVKQCESLLSKKHNRNWAGLQEHQICAGKLAGGVDACHGDSGGPLQVQISLDHLPTEYRMYYVVGVTAFGFGCARRNLPGVYTRVSSFVDWIEPIVWKS